MRAHRHKGFALGLLVAVLALASVTVLSLLVKDNEMRQQARWVKQTASVLSGQAVTVSRAILRCGTQYPDGSNGNSASPEAARKYPSSESRLALVRCPGAPSASAKVFSGRDGAFVARLPGADFEHWAFLNDSTGLSASLVVKTNRAREAARAAARESAGTMTFEGTQLRVTIVPPADQTSPESPSQPASSPEGGNPPPEPGESACGPEPQQPTPPPSQEGYAQFEQDWVRWQNDWSAWQQCLVDHR